MKTLLWEKKTAKELNGTDVGRDIRQTVMDWSTAKWDRERGEYISPPTRSEEFFTINMITHKKNGEVRVRTKHNESVFLPDGEVVLW